MFKIDYNSTLYVNNKNLLITKSVKAIIGKEEKKYNKKFRFVASLVFRFLIIKDLKAHINLHIQINIYK